MVVERDLAFENFIETPFWELKGIAKDPKSGIEFPISIKYNGQDKIMDENIAKIALNNMSKAILVSNYQENIKYSKPSNPFSLLDMAAEVFNTNGLSMTRSENAAQSLYDKGLLSYPRTEERYYSNGEYKQSQQVIKGLQENDYFKNLTNLKYPYWKEMFESLQDSKEKTLPMLNSGDKLEIISVELDKKFTKPKPRFTELSLAQAMEKISSIYNDEDIVKHLTTGIGTPATRKKIIQDLKSSVIDNKKVEPYLFIPAYGEDKGKIVSSKKARDMIQLLPDNITSPILRAKLEEKTNLIVSGEINIETFKIDLKKDISDMYNSIIQLGLDKGIRKYNMWNDDGRPSKNQVDFIKKMAEYNKLNIPDGVLENKEMLSHWLDKKEKFFRYPLTDKQKELLSDSTNYKVKNLLKQKDFSQSEFAYLSEQIKYKLINDKKSWSYTLSDKQRELLENKENNVSQKVIDIITNKTEYNIKEWDLIQKSIKEVFNKPKDFKSKVEIER